MNFTNTKNVVETDGKWVAMQVPYQVWNQVDDQVSWKVYDQIYPIRNKIEQEIKK